MVYYSIVFFFQKENAVRDLERSRGVGEVYMRESLSLSLSFSLSFSHFVAFYLSPCVYPSIYPSPLSSTTPYILPRCKLSVSHPPPLGTRPQKHFAHIAGTHRFGLRSCCVRALPAATCKSVPEGPLDNSRKRHPAFSVPSSPVPHLCAS